MPVNTEVMTQSPDNLTRRHGKSLFRSKLMHAAGSLAFGMFTVVANTSVDSKLNQPREDFLSYHCLNNLTTAEKNEYLELHPLFVPVYFSQIAVTSTVFFLATGGLCKLYDGCKSIYDRACTCFSAPDATAEQPPGGVHQELCDEV